MSMGSSDRHSECAGTCRGKSLCVLTRCRLRMDTLGGEIVWNLSHASQTKTWTCIIIVQTNQTKRCTLLRPHPSKRRHMTTGSRLVQTDRLIWTLQALESQHQLCPKCPADLLSLGLPVDQSTINTTPDTSHLAHHHLAPSSPPPALTTITTSTASTTTHTTITSIFTP